MVAYLIIIAIAAIFTYFAQIYRQTHFLYILFSIIAIAFPAYMAGARNLTVGFDVMLYEYGIFRDACTCNSFIQLVKWNADIEPLFLLINYISAQFSNDIHYALGAISLVTVMFGYMACAKLVAQNSIIPLWLLFATFMLFIFASSMNILRQSVAASISLYLYACVRENGWNVKSILVSLLAITAHSTAIMPVGIFLCYSLMLPKLSKNQFKLFFIIMSVALCGMFYLYGTLLSSFSSITGKDYSSYTDMSAAGGAGWAEKTVSTTYVLLLMYFLWLVFYKYKKYSIILANIREYLCTAAILGLIFAMGGLIMGNLVRLNVYVIPLIMFYICDILYGCTPKCKRIKNNLFLLTVFILLYLRNFYEGIEYSSRILGIN